jgi:formylglycine-generating enzyme required for sulfatase activity
MGSAPEEIAWAIEQGKKSKQHEGYFFMVRSGGPRHRVKMNSPFYLAIYPVTQDEYKRLMGVNPSCFVAKQMDASTFKPSLAKVVIEQRQAGVKRATGKDTSRHPVETVSWEDAIEFCRRLSSLPAERAARRTYRLPTEAEWAYACRAGTTTRWYSGDDEAGLLDCAWYYGNADGTTHPVGLKRPNAWGLYDMHGNVWQWCSDWFPSTEGRAHE